MSIVYGFVCYPLLYFHPIRLNSITSLSQHPKLHKLIDDTPAYSFHFGDEIGVGLVVSGGGIREMFLEELAHFVGLVGCVEMFEEVEEVMTVEGGVGGV